MEYGFISHALLWLIGGMSVVAVITSFAALFSLGRQAYRKD